MTDSCVFEEGGGGWRQMPPTSSSLPYNPPSNSHSERSEESHAFNQPLVINIKNLRESS